MFLRYYIESILDRLLDFNIFLINSKFWNIVVKRFSYTLIILSLYLDFVEFCIIVDVINCKFV